MTSNLNQITNQWNLKKHIVILHKTLDFDSFTITNFKLLKLYSFLKQKSTFTLKRVIKVYLFTNNTNFCVLGIKFHYNLKFDRFWVFKTEEFVVILHKTRVFTNSNPLEFDYTLIKPIRSIR